MTPADPPRPRRANKSPLPVPQGLRATKIEGLDGDYVVLSRPIELANLPTALSGAESDVARRIVAGEANEAIARARGTSLRTVANQVASIFRKLGVASRSELVARLYESSR
jgi:DNA-binding NarL/FixJ family response regulator